MFRLPHHSIWEHICFFCNSGRYLLFKNRCGPWSTKIQPLWQHSNALVSQCEWCCHFYCMFLCWNILEYSLSFSPGPTTGKLVIMIKSLNLCLIWMMEEVTTYLFECVCVHVCVCVCIHVCVCSCVHACVCACVWLGGILGTKRIAFIFPSPFGCQVSQFTWAHRLANRADFISGIQKECAGTQTFKQRRHYQWDSEGMRRHIHWQTEQTLSVGFRRNM